MLRQAFVLMVLLGFMSGTSSGALASERPSKRVPIEGAANSKDVRLGFLMGLAAPSISDRTGGSRLVTGVSAFTWMSGRTELGGTFTTGEANNHRSSLIGIESNFHISALVPAVFLGVVVGTTSSESGREFFPSFDDLYFGPKIGADYFLTPELSLSAELKFIFVMAGPSYTWLQALGGVGFHF